MPRGLEPVAARAYGVVPRVAVEDSAFVEHVDAGGHNDKTSAVVEYSGLQEGTVVDLEILDEALDSDMSSH